MATQKAIVPLHLGPERMIFTDGIFPYICSTGPDTILLQAHLSSPPGAKSAKRNRAGVTGTVITRDGGKLWKRWQPEAWKKQQPLFEGAATKLSDGTLLLVEWVAVPGSRPGIFIARLWESHDGLETFSGTTRATVHLPQARRHDFDDGGHEFSGIVFHRTLLELPGGDLLATVYCSFEEDTGTFAYRSQTHRNRCVLLRSSDRGRHWHFVATISGGNLDGAGTEGFNEPVLTRLSTGKNAGRLICLMRTGGDAPIHQAVSNDEGRTWSQPRALPFMGVDPDLVEMPGGILVCTFGRRGDKIRGTFVTLSADGGQTWQKPTQIPVEAYSNTPWVTTGYSSLHLVSKTEINVFYDVGLWGQPIRYISSRRLKIG